MHDALTPGERALVRRLNTPQKIQDYLDTIPINFEVDGDTHYTPRQVLQKNTAHCIEGAVLGAVCLWYHGYPPLVMDFLTTTDDEDHVVAPFKQNGYWGALSKTNHPIIRYRDPIYRTLHELARSYYHEYFMFDSGKKTLDTYSKPLNLRRFGDRVLTSDDLWWVGEELDEMPHYSLVPKSQRRLIRPADTISRKGASITEWPNL